jgi:SAM-dependent methyltransferase
MMGNPHPDPELETLGQCPLCGSSCRTWRYRDLQDMLFQIAPETWSLWRCAQCGLHYLDPRPTVDSIGRHYSTYYTHDSAPEIQAVPEALSPRFLRPCIDDWLHQQFGVQPAGRLPGGRWVLGLFPGLRRSLACTHRHLRPPHAGAKLLDIGCGNGSFLPLAQRLGWEAHGSESDPAAVAAAQKRNLPVRQGGLPQTGWPDNFFAAVTLNHVIEHVHDPVAAFREIHRVLQPGGWAWVSTPNADSFSHRKYGRHWRGLEPPRHLVVFTKNSLQMAACEAGFETCRLLPPKLMTHWYAQASAILAAAAGATIPRLGRMQMIWANLQALVRYGSGEELYLMVQKRIPRPTETLT